MNSKGKALQDLYILQHYKRHLARMMEETGLDFYTITNFIRRWENRCFKAQREMLKGVTIANGKEQKVK